MDRMWSEGKCAEHGKGRIDVLRGGLTWVDGHMVPVGHVLEVWVRVEGWEFSSSRQGAIQVRSLSETPQQSGQREPREQGQRSGGGQ